MDGTGSEVRFEKVSKRYGRRDALCEVNLCIGAGEMFFLTGHSGAGKSTLMRLIALIEQPTGGRVLVGGKNLGRIGGRGVPAFRRSIGLVFQNHHLLPEHSVFDNVALPLLVAGHSARKTRQRVLAILDQVGLLDRSKQLPASLSAGEQQRVGIARAVIARPKIILADEPTGNLDAELSRDILHLFERFHQAGATVLVATHDMSLVQDLPHAVLQLEHGVLVDGQEGTAGN